MKRKLAIRAALLSLCMAAAIGVAPAAAADEATPAGRCPPHHCYIL